MKNQMTVFMHKNHFTLLTLEKQKQCFTYFFMFQMLIINMLFAFVKYALLDINAIIFHVFFSFVIAPMSSHPSEYLIVIYIHFWLIANLITIIC